MKKFIYYPQFQSYNLNWLKFALIYIEKLSPIIPPEGLNYIENAFKNIRDSSDLIEIVEPQYTYARESSIKAIEIIEKIQTQPERYRSIFHSSNITHNWENPQNHTNTLFGKKYTDDFIHYCKERNFCSEDDNGINVSQSLSFLYMSLLADVVSDYESKSIITDLPDMDRFLFFTKQSKSLPAKIENSINAARSVFDITLPKKLKDIPIETIIKLRNKSDFINGLRAFHTSLDNMLQNIAVSEINEETIKKYLDSRKDFNDLLLTVGTGLSIVGLGIWALMDMTNINLVNILKEVGVVIGFSYSSTKLIKKDKLTVNTRCHKYLADLKTIGM
jgi:hypothetical protein